jgi:3-hydroxyacyl-[acyl-carrier-protein] dehydratase
MLKDHFYTISNLTHQDNTILAVLQLNSRHETFAGHFPGQPVVPGACMLHIVKEILSEALGTPYQLKKGDNLKFIAPIDPLMTPEVALKLTYKTVDAGLYVTAALSANDVVCFKFQGIFQERR